MTAHRVFSLALISIGISVAGCTPKQPGICDLSFVVADSSTQEVISDYALEFPTSLGKPMAGGTHYRKDSSGSFYVPSFSPVEVIISAPGYSDEVVTIQPRFGVTTGYFPEPKKILLSRSGKGGQEDVTNR